MKKEYFEYVMSHFEMIYGSIGYAVNYQSNTTEAKVKIVASETDFFTKSKSIPDKIVWKEWEGVKLPFFFQDTTNKPIYEVLNDGIIINYDLIASAFYLLSQWQEKYQTEKDKLGRFPYEKSIQKKLKIDCLPVVNYYFLIIKEAIAKAYGGEIITQKVQKPILFVSHDIDKVFGGWKEDGLHYIKKGNILAFTKQLISKVLGRNNWYNFDRILALEKKLKINSTFFFLTKKGVTDGVINSDYDFDSSNLEDVFHQIEEHGSEVALHGSMGSAFNKEQISEEIKRFSSANQAILGNRFHYLIFQNEKSFDVLDTSEIKYDCSVGFAEHIGFRNSFCFPYYPFNFEKLKAYSVLEIPLNIMDTTLDKAKYMGVGKENALENCKSLIDEVKKFGGCLSIIWHNNYFSDHKYLGWEKAFISLAEYCKSQGFKSLNGVEIAKKY